MPLHENAIRAFYSVFQRKPVRLDPVDTGSRQENVSEWESGHRNSAGNAFVNGETAALGGFVNALKSEKRLRRIDASVFRAVNDRAAYCAASLPDF